MRSEALSSPRVIAGGTMSKPHFFLSLAAVAGTLLGLSLTGCEVKSDADSQAPLIDWDEDGFDALEDCDDVDPDIWPGAPEYCDDVDSDCDGVIDEHAEDAPGWYADADADGYGASEDVVYACEPQDGYVDNAGDCDDDDPERSPDAEELCDDGIDNNCDGEIDTAAWYRDADADGYGDPEDVVYDCAPQEGYVIAGGDCDDSDPELNPGAGDVYEEGLDQDCDGAVDEGFLLVDDIATAFTAHSDSANAGQSVAFPGDVDGDGVDDLLLGAPRLDWSSESAGGAYFVPGTALEGGILEDIPGVVMLTKTETSRDAGIAVSGADYNSDGYADLLIADPSHRTEEDPAYGARYGAVFVINGPVDATRSLDEADATLLASFEDYGFGGDLDSGDVTGDGVPDVAATAMPYDGRALEDALIAAVFAGPITDGDSEDAWLRLVTDPRDYNSSPIEVSTSGDLNGDGVGDVMVSYPLLPDSADRSVAFLFDGGSGGQKHLSDADARVIPQADASAYLRSDTAGDLNGDGYADLVLTDERDDVGGPESGALAILLGPLAGEHSFEGADAIWVGREWALLGATVSTGGDVNGDGFDDMIVLARNENDEREGEAVHLIPGSAVPSGSWDAPNTQVRMSSDSSADYMGISIALGGDVYGDGRSDLLLGAYHRIVGSYPDHSDGGGAFLLTAADLPL